MFVMGKCDIVFAEMSEVNGRSIFCPIQRRIYNTFERR